MARQPAGVNGIAVESPKKKGDCVGDWLLNFH